MAHVQKCGPGGPDSLPPSYQINSILARVESERVVVSLYLTPYTGPGSYEVGFDRSVPSRTAAPGVPASSAKPYRDMSLRVARIIGDPFDNRSEEWQSTSGSFTIDPDELSGALDVELQPREIDGRILRVAGRWKCSQAEARVPFSRPNIGGVGTPS